jgi:hypothetical protein
MPTSEQGLGTNGSAAFNSVWLRYLTTPTFNSWQKKMYSPAQNNMENCWHLFFHAQHKYPKLWPVTEVSSF